MLEQVEHMVGMLNFNASIATEFLVDKLYDKSESWQISKL